MNTKFLTSVSALAVGLMMASGAAAQIALADDGASATAYEDSNNTDNSVETDYDESFNSDVETDYEDSFNSETDVEDSYNSDASTEVEDSYNSDSSTEVEDSYNSDASVDYEDSFNTDNSTTNTTTNLDLRVVLSSQDLQGTVSGISYNSGGGDGSDQDNLNTGAISWSGNAHQATAGITTESINTGFGSLNQASTMVSANANVTFGAP